MKFLLFVTLFLGSSKAKSIKKRGIRNNLVKVASKTIKTGLKLGSKVINEFKNAARKDLTSGGYLTLQFIDLIFNQMVLMLEAEIKRNRNTLEQVKLYNLEILNAFF